jgi:hypothetical protein
MASTVWAEIRADWAVRMRYSWKALLRRGTTAAGRSAMVLAICVNSAHFLPVNS